MGQLYFITSLVGQPLIEAVQAVQSADTQQNSKNSIHKITSFVPEKPLYFQDCSWYNHYTEYTCN